MRHRHHPARTARWSRHCDPRTGDRRVARPHDGRRRGLAVGAAPASRQSGSRRGCASTICRPQAGDPFAIALHEHLARGPRRRDHRHRRRGRQRPGRVVRGDVRRERCSRTPTRSVIDGTPMPAGSAITGRRRLGAAFVPEERLGHGAAPRMTLSRERRCSPRHADGTGSSVRRRRPRQARAIVRRAHHRGLRRAQGQARSRRPLRCRAAICRNSSSAASSTARARVLVVNQPTWGVDAGAAATIRQALIDLARARLGRAGRSARTSTRCSRSPTASP